MPSSSANSRESFISLASTVEYSQAPYAEFSWQVHQLCKKIWPSSYNDVHIQYLQGGSSNRVIGLSFPSKILENGHNAKGSPNTRLSSGMLAAFDDLSLKLLTEPSNQRFVLRISRFPGSSISRGIASLDYVSNHTSIPVSRIVAYDLTPENAIGSPYSLQYRAPGMPLHLIHSNLTYRQQHDLVKEAARVLLELQKVESPFAGRIGYLETKERKEPYLATSVREALLAIQDNDAGHDEHASDTHQPQPSILHYQLPTRDDLYNGTLSTLKSCNALGIICFQFSRLIIESVPRDRTGNFQASYTIRLLAAAREMDELGCFGYESTMKLYHDDFEPRNIMVTIDNDEFGTVKSSSIIDWDDAIFAPPFVSSLPPRWLWSDTNCNTNEEPQIYEDPTDPELLSLKQMFDDHVGWEFTSYSYEPQYRLARRLFRFAFNGFPYS